MKFSEGNKLAQDPLSGCVVIREHVQHMWLPPRYLNGRIGSGVKELLERQIGKYNESLDGIHLAYSKVKVIQRASFLLYDSVDMHFDVHYDVVIFRVYPGTLLKCTVNKVSADHLSCLIHKVINMSVPVPEWTFDPNQVKGQEMICKVTKVEYKKGVLGIHGELTEDSLATIQERFAASEEMKHEEDEMDISQNIDQSAKMTEKKREKRKKKVCEDIEHQEESLSNTSQNQNDSLFMSGLSLEETSNSQNLEMQTFDQDNSNMKVKKKKKCKREDVDEIRDDEEAETLNLLDQDLLVKDEKRKKKRRKGERRDVSEDGEDLNDSGINGSSSDGHIENDDALYNDSSDGRKKKHKKKKRKIAND